MDTSEFQKLKIDDVLYNKDTSEVVVLTSQFVADKKEVSPDDSLGIRSYDGAVNASIKTSDCESWELVSDDAPDKVKLHICLVRLAMLEHFVYSRLRQ